ncbi:MAG: M48 family metalloprotease [Pirellulales bacterium]
MRFKFPCPYCSATLNAQDDWRGRKATCKSCSKKLVVPLLEQPTVDAEEPTGPNPSVASSETPAEESVGNKVAPAEAVQAKTDEPISAITEPLSSMNFEIVEPTQPETELATSNLIENVASELAEVTEGPVEEVPAAIIEVPSILEKTNSADDLSDFASPLASVGGSSADTGTTGASSTRVEFQQPVVSDSIASLAVATAAKTTSQEVNSDLILNSIRGSIKPVQTTVMYRLAVIPVAILMIILPLVYIALIAGVGYFTCWYAVNGLSVFEGVNPSGGGGRSRGMGAVLMYAGPLFASALTFIFLIKPLFARTKRSTAQIAIKPEQQPAMFAFVEQIAKAVHAPKPTSIVIDTEVNASASFRRGWLSLLRRGDLELTIGLPLVERLTAQELAGVLAHEFGHFSQGLGMRLQYIVRSINMWFAQVVYQRDRADQWLANSARELHIRIRIVVYCTMFMIWLSRRVLWVLMMIGHGFSSILLRQMEYDADQHEIRLAGSDRFVSTAQKLPRLAVAYQEAAMQMQHAFADERLVNHLPALVGINFDQQSAEILQKLDEHSASEKSSWFDTHPLNRDRIARAEQSASRGIMSLDIPASQLFQDYDALAKNVTRQFYVEIFEGEFKDSMLTEIDQVQALMESSKADYKARVKLLGEEFAVVRPIPLSSATNRHEEFQQLLVRAEQIQKAMAESVEEFKKNCKSLEELERRWITAYQALSFQSCGITFKEKVWEGVPVDSAASTQRAADQTQFELGQLHERLAKFEKLLNKESIQRFNACGALRTAISSRQRTFASECSRR